MFKNRKISKLLLFAFAISIILTPSFASAQMNTGSGELRLTTSPLPINLKVTPGNAVSAPVKIKNDGNQSEDLKVTLMKFKADPITGAAQLFDRQAGDDYFDWVTFSDNTFTLPSNEWKTVTATFNVPTSAAFDYYYAIVFFRQQQQIKPGDRQTVLNGGTATLVLLTAEVPNAKKELQLDQFTVEKNIFEFLPVNFDVKLKNIGNVHVIPHGDIFISKGDQKEAAVLHVNSTQGAILPNSPRDFQISWNDGFPNYVFKQENGNNVQDAQGKPIEQLNWNWANASNLRWGKYTAKMLVVYDDGKRDVPIEAEVSFWVIPWRLLGGSLVVLIFVLVGLKSTLQNIFKKVKKVSVKKEITVKTKTKKKKSN